MKISLNWLSQYIDLSGLSVDEMSDMLTFAGIEVEDIRQQGVDSPYVVVARVAAAEQHPQADRLKVCQVDVGDGTLHQIVCGAQNYKVGDKVPCALPGAVLPGNVEIKVGKLRGVESRGMLCSASELGLPDKEHGLWILPQELEPGTPISQVVKADTLVEVEVTPNRPDLLSHNGMAYELAAISGREYKPVPIDDAGVALEPAGGGRGSGQARRRVRRGHDLRLRSSGYRSAPEGRPLFRPVERPPQSGQGREDRHGRHLWLRRLDECLAP